jgi:ribonuclease E
MRRRQQREAQQSKVAAPKVQPSQIPDLANYTLGSSFAMSMVKTVPY